MDRLNRAEKGITLLELIVATILFTVVVFAAFNLLINFGNFSSNLVRSESSLTGTALGPFEEITGKITVGNEMAIPANGSAMNPPNVPYPAGCAGVSCIQIRMDNATLNAAVAATPDNYGDDTVYNYWQNGTLLLRSINNGANTTIANNIISFNCTRTAWNRVIVTLDANGTAGGGPANMRAPTEHLTTEAVLRARSSS